MLLTSYNSWIWGHAARSMKNHAASYVKLLSWIHELIHEYSWIAIDPFMNIRGYPWTVVGVDIHSFIEGSPIGLPCAAHFPKSMDLCHAARSTQMNIFVNPWISHSTIHEFVLRSKKHAALNSWTSSQFMNSCHAARSTQLWIHELRDNSWICVTQ